MRYFLDRTVPSRCRWHVAAVGICRLLDLIEHRPSAWSNVNAQRRRGARNQALAWLKPSLEFSYKLLGNFGRVCVRDTQA